MSKVRYTFETLPNPDAEDIQRLEELAEMADEAIDTSDIPELTDDFWEKARASRLYRPRKQQLTIKLDADVLAWLKSGGKGYQTRMNTILRRAMLEQGGVNTSPKSKDAL